MNKPFKRALAITLAGAMSFGSILTVGAEEAPTFEKLEKLKDLGIIQGEGAGVDPFKDMTRYRGIGMMFRLSLDDSEGKNLEDYMNAYDYEGKPNFKDAENQAPYIQRLMGYSKNNEVGVNGYPDGELKPLKKITHKEFAVVMLEALGYKIGVDFNWATAAAKAAAVGIVENASDASDEVVLIHQVGDMTYNALATPRKGATITLGEALGKPVVETKLKVASVEALNLKQIEIKFNKVVDKDSATKLDNYKVKGKTVKLTNGSADLLEDGKTVVLTLGTAARDQQEEVDVTVSSIKDATGRVVERKVVENLVMLDQTYPKALEAKAIGSKTIKVKFSEPIKTVSKSNFKIKQADKNLYIKSVTPVKNGTEVNITLYQGLEVGTVEVQTQAGITDYAGFSVMLTDLTASVEEDKEGPVVVGFKDATPNSVTLIFNEDISIKKKEKENYFHTNGSNTIKENIDVEKDVDGKELTLNFAEGRELSIGGVTHVYIATDTIEDLWGNKNQHIMTQVNVDVDKDAPVIKDFDVKAENEVEITFNEDLKSSTAIKRSNYKLLDDEGKEVKLISSIKYADKVVTMKFTKKLSGSYVLVINDVEDLRHNKIRDLNKDFVVEDLTAPLFKDMTATLYNAGRENQKVKIKFPEKMATSGVYSVLDLAKYKIDGKELQKLKSEVDITMLGDEKSVEIRIPSKTEDKTNGIDLSSKDVNVELARVADAAGNYTKEYVGTIKLEGKGSILIDSVEATTRNDKKVIKVKFNDELNEAIEPEDIIITKGAIKDSNNDGIADKFNEAQAKALDISGNTIEVDGGKTIVVLELADQDALKNNATDSTDAELYAYIISEKSKNNYNEYVKKGNFKKVEDKIKPTLVKDKEVTVSTADDKTKFTLHFTENVKVANLALVTGDLQFVVNTSDGDKNLAYGIDYTINTSEFATAAGAKDIEIQLTGDYTKYRGPVTVKIKDTANVQYIKDLNGNGISGINKEFEIE